MAPRRFSIVFYNVSAIAPLAGSPAHLASSLPPPELRKPLDLGFFGGVTGIIGFFFDFFGFFVGVTGFVAPRRFSIVFFTMFRQSHSWEAPPPTPPSPPPRIPKTFGFWVFWGCHRDYWVFFCFFLGFLGVSQVSWLQNVFPFFYNVSAIALLGGPPAHLGPRQ